jgi:hypothetical protein
VALAARAIALFGAHEAEPPPSPRRRRELDVNALFADVDNSPLPGSQNGIVSVNDDLDPVLVFEANTAHSRQMKQRMRNASEFTGRKPNKRNKRGGGGGRQSRRASMINSRSLNKNVDFTALAIQMRAVSDERIVQLWSIVRRNVAAGMFKFTVDDTRYRYRHRNRARELQREDKRRRAAALATVSLKTSRDNSYIVVINLYTHSVTVDAILRLLRSVPQITAVQRVCFSSDR